MGSHKRQESIERDTTGGDEINREGARRYGEGVRENARAGNSDEQAHEAAEALDGPEGEALRQAENAGKARARRRA